MTSASNDNPAEIELVGPGPYLLPLCGEAFNIVVGDVVCVLQIETLSDQRIDIPIPTAALAGLVRAGLDALRELVPGEPGATNLKLVPPGTARPRTREEAIQRMRADGDGDPEGTARLNYPDLFGPPEIDP